MTARQVYEGMLVEINKVLAPSMLLEDFNYLLNKAIYLYINKRYNIYDVNQQTSDDIRVLKATTVLPVTNAATKYQYGTLDGTGVTSSNALYNATYECDLPSDYLHILNCICNFKVLKQFKCYNANTYVQFAATRLTADAWSQVINNFYMKPSYRRPYFYLHNINTSITNPTNTYVDSTHTGTDVTATNTNGTVTISGGLPNSIQIGGGSSSNVEKTQGVRYGNNSLVRLEIRYGKDTSLFQLENVYIDYLKTPQFVRLTQEQLDLTEDTSQIIEFQDYICQEIINELVKLFLENSSDPRLQTNIPVNQTIANPAQQLATNKK